MSQYRIIEKLIQHIAHGLKILSSKYSFKISKNMSGTQLIPFLRHIFLPIENIEINNCIIKRLLLLYYC